MSLTHCMGGGCPLQQLCLRHTRKVLGRQNFFGQIPYDSQSAQCEYFYEEKPSEQLVEQLAYQLWQADGCPDGKALSYWLRARQQLILKQRQSG